MCRLPQEFALPIISVFEIVSQRTGWVGGVYGGNRQLLLTPGNVVRPRLHKCPSPFEKIGPEVGGFDTANSVRQR